MRRGWRGVAVDEAAATPYVAWLEPGMRRAPSRRGMQAAAAAAAYEAAL